MAKFPFVGPSYVYPSLNFDAQRSINLYPVASETKDSKSIIAMMGSPGLLAFSTLGSSACRGAHKAEGRAFFVAGNTLYEVMADGSNINRGTLQSVLGIVQMADSGVDGGNQMVIVDGPYGYVFNLTTNAFALITSAGWLGSYTVSYIDGYFLFIDPATQLYYISGLLDGSTEDPLDFSTLIADPGNLVGSLTLHDQAWMFGENAVQVLYNSGAALFPFQKFAGAYIEYGCAARYTIAKTANQAFWVGSDGDGNGVVWMSNGYNAQRISTFAVEFAIQQLGDISLSTAFTYQEGGHYFYCINFTGSPTTWVYDISMELWHERGYFTNGAFSQSLGQFHVFCFGKHLVGDYTTGIVYEQSLKYTDDNGTEIRIERTAPHIADEEDLELFFHRRLQIDMQTGIGQTNGQDADPQIGLVWSDDGGHTWSNEHWRSAGKIGVNKTRAIWRQLGRSRDRVYKAIFTASCAKFIIGANLKTDQGTS